VVYRITPHAQPRLLVFYAIMALIVAAGAASILLVGPLIGLIILAASLFIAWSMLKVVRRQLSMRVETLTDEILFVQHGDEKLSFPWEKIFVAGFSHETEGSGRKRRAVRRLFIYNEQDDRVISLTDEFECLDGLAAELREHAPFRELTLEEGQTLKERLRELVGQG
jgi:hypothetical protein